MGPNIDSKLRNEDFETESHQSIMDIKTPGLRHHFISQQREHSGVLICKTQDIDSFFKLFGKIEGPHFSSFLEQHLK